MQIIKTEVFAAIPDTLRIRDRVTDWHTRKLGGAVVDCFLEGPSFDRVGNLYLVDIPFGRVFRVTEAGEFSVFAEYDGQPNGLKIRQDGQIFIADQQNGIVQIDPDTRQATTVLSEVEQTPMRGPNDLFFAASGNLYFTDQGDSSLHDPSGRVCVLRPDGGCNVLLDRIPGPNGIVVDEEEKNIFLAVTRGNCIWRIVLRNDGAVHRAGVFIQLSGSLIGPDGLALDAKGGLLVAHAGRGVVRAFDRLGDPVQLVESCAGLLTTNLAFRPGTSSLYIVESEHGLVLRAEMPTPGAPMYSHT